VFFQNCQLFDSPINCLWKTDTVLPPPPPPPPPPLPPQLPLFFYFFPSIFFLKITNSFPPPPPPPSQPNLPGNSSFCLILAFKDFVFSDSPLWNFQNPPWGGYGYNYSGTTHYYCHSDCVPNWTEEDHSHFVLKIDKTPRLMLCTIQSLSWLKSYIHVQCKILAVRSHRIWPKILQ